MGQRIKPDKPWHGLLEVELGVGNVPFPWLMALHEALCAQHCVLQTQTNSYFTSPQAYTLLSHLIVILVMKIGAHLATVKMKSLQHCDKS